ncbi:DUF5689 domain-containing protein [Pontimicrobium sp. IMCC45349]|uniref:DUF5689 domain-containing protein n=1 Tax=Pontimicrobium sp. IMCC45349 TaxID=3391574 RepID=UPI0039A3797D
MKTNKLLNIVLVAFAMVAMTACVQDDDFTVPNSLGDEENAGLQEILTAIQNEEMALVTISQLKAMYNGQVTLIESDIVVKGYVTSSDATGNFYKEFYMQDAPENPTAAIGVVLNLADNYNRYNKGREVYIKLKGLFLGENSSEVLTIGGAEDGDEVDEITANMIPDFLFRSNVTETIVPLTVGMSSVNDAHLGMFVQFENAQFPAGLEGQTFVAPYDDFDTQRALVSCDNGAEFLIETSSFANFNQMPLPTQGRGTIAGVISQSYGGDDIVMLLNTTDDISFDGNRCDPVFEETFSSATDNTDLNVEGWLNYAEDGSELWTEQVYSGNGYAEFSAYQSGDSNNVGWLISPAIDMDAQDGEMLNFQTEYAYPDAGHDPLEVFVSTDFNGTTDGVASATWIALTDAVIAHPDVTDDWFTWIDSGAIDLSSYTGNLYIAFKYTGSDTSNQNGTIHVDNVIISIPE